MAADNFAMYGSHQFKGAVADQFLANHGATSSLLSDPTWTEHSSDVVASAVLDWATQNGASSYAHWFQPMAASGVRHGLTGQVQNMMMKFHNKDNTLMYDFKGKDLIRGETDGSSFPNGGLRATHTAGGYLALDTSSSIFLRGDVVFIPSAFVSYYGAALDEKTPLLRANEAMSLEGCRLLKLLGVPESKLEGGLVANIGLEQEFFLVPREHYLRRLDLQMSGRTVMGKFAPRGQEMCDHYMSAMSMTTPALACMQQMQEECWKMGIPLKTRHREVAPGQYEFAPLFGVNTGQIDQNIMVMQVIEEVAAQHGLAALLQEKPFEGINGSGKHNNWSISNVDGSLNLLNAKDMAEYGSAAFPTIVAAIISGFEEHGDALRMSISVPGNEFRLGACEAPPAIISSYLGDDMTNYLAAFKDGNDDVTYAPSQKVLDLGTKSVQPFNVPAEDRNRTSPLPYGGSRFEFRAVGSSANVSMTNTVLNTITAEKFQQFSEKIEGGETAKVVTSAALNKAWRVIFNGDNYCEENQKMLTKRGIWRIDSAVEAIHSIVMDKNVELFQKLNVMTKEECEAREMVMHNHYIGTVELEALSMVDMINQNVVPAVKDSELGASLTTDILTDLTKSVSTIKESLGKIHRESDPYEAAKLARILRLETMVEIREICDTCEGLVPADLWTIATYKELLFLDQNDSSWM